MLGSPLGLGIDKEIKKATCHPCQPLKLWGSGGFSF
jgi:hypothetical protein